MTQKLIFNKDQLKQQIKAFIPFHDEDIEDDDNLLEIGLDSMSIMQLINLWRSQGSDITFSHLVDKPKLSAWYALLKRD
jgi:yersiniabactin nonribosomal peptide synthetase